MGFNAKSVSFIKRAFLTTKFIKVVFLKIASNVYRHFMLQHINIFWKDMFLEIPLAPPQLPTPSTHKECRMEAIPISCAELKLNSKHIRYIALLVVEIRWCTHNDNLMAHIDGLVQEKSKYTDNTLELRLPCINPRTWTRKWMVGEGCLSHNIPDQCFFHHSAGNRPDWYW